MGNQGDILNGDRQTLLLQSDNVVFGDADILLDWLIAYIIKMISPDDAGGYCRFLHFYDPAAAI
ncbi:hypothetical protein ASE99_24090 [Serratia sp. Leaf51]|nr:hypothetical protein ASE99_24090 [Serratia sp. Leaf51]